MARPSINPVVWQPPAAPERARRSDSAPPMPAPRVLAVNGTGPEDVVVDEQGRLVTGVEDGRILRLSDDGRRIDQVADTQGRPLGVELLGDGRLLVCDAERGLLAVDPEGGSVEALVAGRELAAGRPLRLCNNAAVARDGTVFFTDSTQRFGVEHFMADLLEHGGTGRLLRRDVSGEVTELLDGLQFANGVALSADESYVAVAETGSYRISRVWLDTGRSEVLADNLPGIPDNLSTGADGLIWVALATPRNPVLDWTASRNPLLRKATWALPPSVLTRFEVRTTWVVAIDDSGAIVRDLQTSAPGYHMVTGVRQHGGKLYLGSLREQGIAVIDL
ncbi:SMP-30/gluconolactonase/LRE family protein [Kutzneria kofuensis]|uniref:Sugar lactone lactonase YvrE n=1 Tax=Kutzneria kofuensis TaxID=103725 RepID=A0A7W9KEQ4_9PSEU|nr:SMP-30/gluconolactonase/LRE family protein [Kutzneria kofuensis]MBB5891208.1 sugar lactone lactonase YvrE [Kutzneria kofuensis]